MRRALASILMSVAHIAFGIGITGWWFNHTVLDPGATTDVAAKVLANDAVTDQLSRVISAAISTQLNLPPETVANIVRQQTHTPAGVELLQSVVSQAHMKVIGDTTAPVTITPEQLATMFGDSALQLAPVEVPVPEVAPLSWLRTTLSDIVPMAFLVAIMAAVLAFLVDSDKAAALRALGIGALIIAGTLAVLGYVIPVLIAPQLTSSPWVEAVPELAEAQLSVLWGVALLCVGAGLAAFTGAAILSRR